MPDPGQSRSEDPLARLEARLDRATQAAESLIAEAGAAAPGAGHRPTKDRPPPAGWQAPKDAEDAAPDDLDLLLAVAGSLRELIPTDLERRLADALRELLLALRALIDWYLERAGGDRREAPEVQDIPIL